MGDKELQELMDLLYPYFIKKMKADGTLKNYIKSVNASVTWVEADVSNIGKIVKVKLPYDSVALDVINKSVSELAIGDLVCLHYNIDLKNAYVAYKV